MLRSCAVGVQAVSHRRTLATRAGKSPVTIVFVEQKKSVTAMPGEVLADVFLKADVDLELGCNQGNCGVCEVGFCAAGLWKRSFFRWHARTAGRA